jgi:hypothetical protein
MRMSHKSDKLPSELPYSARLSKSMTATKLLLPLLGLAGTFSIRAAASADWLIDPSAFKAQIHQSAERHEVMLDNGLVRRVIRLAPNAATVSFENAMTGESIIRGVRPEARVVLDGVRYDIGGLDGQPVQNFLKAAWIGNQKPGFHGKSAASGCPKIRRGRHLASHWRWSFARLLGLE